MRTTIGILLLALLYPPAGRLEAAETFDSLRQRVQAAPVLALNDPGFPQILIIGSRVGGQLLFATVTTDPLDPDTLDAHFDDWNLSSRASLLLDYARLVTEPDTPRAYTGISDQERRELLAWDAAARARIAQVVRAGGYASNWQAFVTAYRTFTTEAAKVVPLIEAPDESPIGVYKAIGRIAADQGLYRLIREAHVDPADVTNEMLRLLAMSRAKLGAPLDASTDTAYLLYTCPSKSTVNVNVHTWHKLAPAFFKAWAVADKKRNDPDATLIVTTFDGLSAAINSWVIAHPEADSAARDRELNRIAAQRGLMSQLEHYGAPTTPTQSPDTGTNPPVSERGLPN